MNVNDIYDIINTLYEKVYGWIVNFHVSAEQIQSWFTYDPKNPLLFSSALFLGLFIVFYTIYIITKKCIHFRTVYILLFSLFFYYKAGGMFFILLVASSIGNYYLAKMMDSSEKKSVRKRWLSLIVVLNLLVLGYYKYTNFFIDNINTITNIDVVSRFFSDLNIAIQTNFALQNIILPIGISFFTFQAISYAVDLYRKEVKPANNLLDFAFFLCFFPQLVAGPIVRAKEFIPQINKKVSLSREEAGAALFMILSGLIKKAVISDYISLNFVDRIFDSPLSYTSFENLMAVYGYTLQIYCDFSGYSDMAIGLALLMGFTLPKNFDSPYKSSSITEFWRRWHISLSSWLRDYLYIPLGGNRKGKIRTYVNLFLTMLIGGLWHGASWKFVVWGGLHGTILAIERFFKQFIKVPDKRIINVICILFTFHFVAFCWIFFRASSFDSAYTVITQIGSLYFDPKAWWSIVEVYRNVFILILIGYLLHFCPQKVTDKVKLIFEKTPAIFKAAAIGFIFWIVYATASSGPQPFIYFQF